MADWVCIPNVEFSELQQLVPYELDHYQLEIKYTKDNEEPSRPYSIKIWDSQFINQMIELFEGKRKRCCFAFGMQDIDIYRMKNGIFAITHSPFEGLNIQFQFKDGEFQKLIDSLGELQNV